MTCPKLAGVGLRGVALVPRLHSSAPLAGVFLPVTGQGSAPFLPLRWSAAVVLIGEAAGLDGDKEQEMVLLVLSREAENARALLTTVETDLKNDFSQVAAAPPQEDTEAATNLKNYFSELAAAASKGQVEKVTSVRALIVGVHRLMELTYKFFPSAPQVSVPTTEDQFVKYFMFLGDHYPEISSGFFFIEGMGQYPETRMDRGYLTSMTTSMNLARLMEQKLRYPAQFPDGNVTNNFTLPEEMPAPQAGPDESLSDGMHGGAGGAKGLSDCAVVEAPVIHGFCCC